VTLAGAERIRFSGRTPVGFADLLGSNEASPATGIDGWLVLPTSSPAPFPLVITTLGSLGLDSGREELYARAFAEAGFATLVVDSLASRGIGETFSDQGRLSLATSCADALYALRHMVGDTRIDQRRVAMFGYSRGGCAVMLSDDARLAQAVLGDEARFAAYVALYPSVWLQWKNPRPAPGPLLVVLGEGDVMVPLPLARRRAEQLAAAGARVETLVIEDAAHGFDLNAPVAYKDEMNMCDCDVLIADDGTMQERASRVRLEDDDWSRFIDRLRGACGKRGAVVGYGPQPRTVAVAPVVDFLRRSLV